VAIVLQRMLAGFRADFSRMILDIISNVRMAYMGVKAAKITVRQ
jgi:hypothetical protein